MQLSHKQRIFSEFLFPFVNWNSILNIFKKKKKKKINLIPAVFFNLRTPKNVVR